MDCLRVDFTWEEVKEPFWYGLKTGIPGLIGSTLSFINFTLWVTYLPQYTTYVTLAGIGGSIPSVMNWFGTPRITPLISESYLNDKKELTRYYVGQYVRFYAEIQGFFVPILAIVNYVPGLVFVYPGLLINIINPYLGVPGQVMYAANRPNFAIIMGLFNNIMNTVFLAMLLVWWNVPENYSNWIPWVYVCYTLPMGLLFNGLNYWYLNKNILKLKIPWGQIIFGFVLAAVATYGLCYMVYETLFQVVLNLYGFYVAAVICMIIFFIFLLLGYFPMTAFFGGWDDENLAEFEKAAYMSGPSKAFVLPVFKLVKFSCKRSKLHNKFAPDMETIERQARELLVIKRMNRDEYKDTHM